MEKLMIVGEHTLDQFESERLVEEVELEELRTLAIPQKAQVLEDGKRVACRRAEGLCRSIWKRDGFELVGEQHPAIFLDDLVDDEHDQLA
jgi:hypothetical protein